MGGMSVRRLIPVLLLAAAIAERSTVSFAQTPAAPAGTPITFTEEQAAAGAEVFSRICLACHPRKDMSNVDFRVKWNSRTAFDFFELVRSTMPQDGPGSLERAEYVGITAYIAKLNGVAAGTTPLPEDEAGLKKMLLSFPPQLR